MNKKWVLILSFVLFACSTNVTDFRKDKNIDYIFYSNNTNFDITMDSPKSFSADENYYFNGDIYVKIYMDCKDNKCYYDSIDLKVFDENHNYVKITRIDVVKNGILVAKNVDFENALKKYDFNEVYFVCESSIVKSSKIYVDYKIKISVQDDVYDYWDENVELIKYNIKVGEFFTD